MQHFYRLYEEYAIQAIIEIPAVLKVQVRDIVFTAFFVISALKTKYCSQMGQFKYLWSFISFV